MLTNKVKKRAYLLAIFLLLSVIAIFLILKSLSSNILYFKSPTDIKIDNELNLERKIRVGGMVKTNTLVIDETEIKFIITDFKNELRVSYSGTIPNLFSEGKGVVAEGKLQDKNFFIADRILAKHDENYMPPELKEIMLPISGTILYLTTTGVVLSSRDILKNLLFLFIAFYSVENTKQK